jgi:hypothetical protein
VSDVTVTLRGERRLRANTKLAADFIFGRQFETLKSGSEAHLAWRATGRHNTRE